MHPEELHSINIQDLEDRYMVRKWNLQVYIYHLSFCHFKKKGDAMKDIHEDSVVDITLLSFIEKEHRTDMPMQQMDPSKIKQNVQR
jgi:hypothetical protein